MKKNETKIEKTLRELDDLHQFYKKIPKIKKELKKKRGTEIQ